jgi:hypothetical protein
MTGIHHQRGIINRRGFSGSFSQTRQEKIFLIIYKKENMGKFQGRAPAGIHPGKEPFFSGSFGSSDQQAGFGPPIVLFQVYGKDKAPSAGMIGGSPFKVYAGPPGRRKNPFP